MNFILSKESKAMSVLMEVYGEKDSKHIQLSFKERWINMERVDKVETLVSIEREVASMRSEICKELSELSQKRL